ncbi:hypothetical protein BKA83DRAFT_13536 [Pisolithus microcarpus]|nr:hypothetical protein BKA83DRAFT_13536 [Pisolithus microcarpus]
MKQMKRSTDSVFALTTTYLDAIIVVTDLESTRAARSTEVEGIVEGSIPEDVEAELESHGTKYTERPDRSRLSLRDIAILCTTSNSSRMLPHAEPHISD